MKIIYNYLTKLKNNNITINLEFYCTVLAQLKVLKQKSHSAIAETKTYICPLKNKCLTKNVIYKATVTTIKKKQHVESTGWPFKTMCYCYIRDLKVHKENGTELSKYIWKLKNNSICYNINWIILHHIGEIRSPQRICMTCYY